MESKEFFKFKVNLFAKPQTKPKPPNLVSILSP